MGMRCLFLQMQHYGETQGAIAMQPFCESVANIVVDYIAFLTVF